MSKRWSETTKWLVIISSLLALVWIIARFSQIISPLAIAVILAYVLNPPVRFLTTRTRLPRTLVVASIYLALIVILSLMLVAFVPSLIQQVTSIDVDLQDSVEGISRFFRVLRKGKTNDNASLTRRIFPNPSPKLGIKLAFINFHLVLLWMQ